ncbi:hypothetical protein AKJ35_00305 [candidate division MSBL1 archaeon SCGC-AAA833F18]|uniref:RCK C-terminal domain-containing protein n=4 Tax=candidate division MSBL1 TaxID=215777 RepID=A0A133V1U2_9EURY|nr:hypothetical protein AKJ42_00815 [candidate division MSBL1 archaeon SCGC-AAA261C02]KXB03977.1 hypothetical protein AKJ48_03510 [candidate division MSBL1 archaeon SCGC-AAA261O19]KXB04100.1 hypothetical protein AKJ47_00710 [candidate division MSBL1 archaeon SCGC-AAA261G05]KXB09683.1 hypothetical protein AKJ35_00305 [candidate division MSBL1 archaeon SCGC-AAA833F18]
MSEEYESRNVRELLTEMKDVSDITIDLAYASLQFENEELAEQVIELEELMDELMYQIRTLVSLSVRSVDDAERTTGILQVADAAEEISNATGDLADIVLRDIEVHPVIKSALKKANEKLSQVKVRKDSEIDGKAFHELKLPSRLGVWVLAIQRGEKWKIAPTQEAKVKAGDLLIIRGPQEGIDTFCEMASAPERDWRIGKKYRRLKETLARMRDTGCLMVDMAYSSALFKSVEVAEEVREVEEQYDELNYAVWREVLKAAKREKDVTKLNSALQVVKCIERLTDAADSIVDVVLRGVELHPVFEQALEEADERISRVKVSKKSPLADRTLGKLDLWSRIGAYVLVIKRGKDYKFNPTKGVTVRAGDFLIIRGSTLGVEELERVAAGKTKLPLEES